MKRRRWTDAEIELLRGLYPDTPTAKIAERLGRDLWHIYAKAMKLELRKSDAYLASPAACRLRRGDKVGLAFRFAKGTVPPNKGLRRPGWYAGRMRETQFKKGGFPANRDPAFYVPGALRVNSEGYVDMRTSFAPGAAGWTPLHRILWEDAHGPIPRGFNVTFKDCDRLNVELANLELISRADLMRRNTIHNLPENLRLTVQALGHLKRRIRREEQSRGPAQSPIRDARGPS